MADKKFDENWNEVINLSENIDEENLKKVTENVSWVDEWIKEDLENFNSWDIVEEDLKKQYEPEAIKAIKSRLALEVVVKSENIEATDEEINAKIEEMAKNYGKEPKDLQENENVRNYIKEGIVNEKAIAFLLENCKEKKPAKKETKKEDNK